MGPIDLLKAITIIATACHLCRAQNWIKSNDLVSTDMTLEGQMPSSRSKRAVTVKLTTKQIVELVQVHNYLRTREGASNMELMTWNHQLAEMGQLWADQCTWRHAQPSYPNPPYDQLGQNLWANEAGPNMTSAIYAFWEEKQFYNYNNLKCQPNEVCGHYTQVAWAASREVGCGLVTCRTVSYLKNAAYLVCNYGPAGNFVGQKPFLKGPPCTQCESGNFWCIKGLCTDTCSGKTNCECAAICKNCATFQKATCSCECANGWTGPDCSEPCKDLALECGANPGWPFSWCEGHQYSDHVRKNCPKFCHICKSGLPNQSQCPPKGVGPGLSYTHPTYNGYSGSPAHHTKEFSQYFALIFTVFAVVYHFKW